MGKIRRFVTCVSIDSIDENAYCGTKNGDILEISLKKGIYERSGPVNKLFTGAVNQVISIYTTLYVATSEGELAKLDKKGLSIIGEIKFEYASLTGLAAS